MAINKVPANTILRLELRTGVNANGNPVYRNRSLNNVKPSTADQDIFDVANALANLQEYPLNGISRVDAAALVQS